MWQITGRPEGDGGVFFVEVCRRGLKFSAGKNKVMVLGGEEGLECKIMWIGYNWRECQELKYLGCVLDESVADVTGVIRRWLVGGKL